MSDTITVLTAQGCHVCAEFGVWLLAARRYCPDHIAAAVAPLSLNAAILGGAIRADLRGMRLYPPVIPVIEPEPELPRVPPSRARTVVAVNNRPPGWLRQGLWRNRHGEGVRCTRFRRRTLCTDGDGHEVRSGLAMWEYHAVCPVTVRAAQYEPGVWYCEEHAFQTINFSRWDVGQHDGETFPQRVPAR